MSKPLVIVESPAKAKTIGKFLGKDYVVKASMGHVRDLPRSGLAVYPERNFEADWEPIKDRAKVVAELRKHLAATDTVYLATDPDREGEAIAWHLAELLLGAKRAGKTVQRVHFHEITKGAIREAFEHPRQVDENLVDAYRARRILDRLVGYQLSELLWKKLTRGLSAGRVQSVAVKLIVEREREIRAFVPQEYWKLVARFAHAGQSFEAEFKKLDGKGKELKSATDVGEVLGRVARPLATAKDAGAAQSEAEYSPSGAFTLSSLKQAPRRVSAKPPFKTSTLQQAAAGRYGFAAKRTMRIAQQLYEGIELPGEGGVGLITYMRTDSFNIAETARAAARDVIVKRWGENYLPEKPNYFRSKQSAQEAHEAIRPTDPARTPESVRSALSEEQWKLYDLVWRRFIACQMAPAEYLVTTLELTRGGATFTASGRVTTFAGFTAVYGAERDEEQPLPPLTEGQELTPSAIVPTRHFTTPPRRYTEASLVKALEEFGIGRPSTYASILSTIVDRKYVDHGEEADQERLRREFLDPTLVAKPDAEELAEREDAQERPDVAAALEGDDEEAFAPRQRRKTAFHATHLGEVTTDLLEPQFGDIVNTAFTAKFEDDLDAIAEGKAQWQEVVGGFYDHFSKDLAAAQKSMAHYRANPLIVPDIKCGRVDEKTGEVCGAPMVLLFNRGGAYLGCSRYPDCSFNLPLSGQRAQNAELTDFKCQAKDESGQLCGRPMEKKVNRWGRPFLACTGYKSKECKGAVSLSSKGEPLWPVATSVPCPENCGRLLNVKRSRRGKFLACPGYPKCRGTLNLPSCPHESKGGKLCGLPMTEPGPNGTMICREHPQVALAPPPKAARGEEKESAEAEPVKAKAGKAKAPKAAAPRKAARKPPAKEDVE